MKRLFWFFPTLFAFLFLFTGCQQGEIPDTTERSKIVPTSPEESVILKKGDEIIGVFFVDFDADLEGDYCQYKVVGISGADCPLESDDIVCIPCKKDNECRKKKSKVNAIIVDEDDHDGRELCRVILESLSDKCGECPEEGFVLKNGRASLGIFIMDERKPNRGERFCRFRVEEIEKEEKKRCPVKEKDIICIPCPEDKKCPAEGIETIIDLYKSEEDSLGCLVTMRSLSGFCTECGKKGKIVKES
jgi:hypothetical protein